MSMVAGWQHDFAQRAQVPINPGSSAYLKQTWVCCSLPVLSLHFQKMGIIIPIWHCEGCCEDKPANCDIKSVLSPSFLDVQQIFSASGSAMVDMNQANLLVACCSLLIVRTLPTPL